MLKDVAIVLQFACLSKCNSQGTKRTGHCLVIIVTL